MQLYKPEDYILSPRMSSKRAPHGVAWQLEIYPNSNEYWCRSTVSIYLNLTDVPEVSGGEEGSAGIDCTDHTTTHLQAVAEKDETLSALVHSYLIRKVGGGRKKVKETLINSPYEFNYSTEFPDFGAVDISHDRVWEALRSDGSLVVGCDIDFLLP